MLSALTKSFTLSKDAAEHAKRCGREIAALAFEGYCKAIKGAPSNIPWFHDRIARAMREEIEDYASAHNLGILQIRKMNALLFATYKEEYKTILWTKRVSVGLPPE